METFRQDVTLRNRITREAYELTDEGAVISEKTAKLLNLQVGDNITLEKDHTEYKAKVAVITENYMGHYVYMTPLIYEKTFGEKPVYEDMIFFRKRGISGSGGGDRKTDPFPACCFKHQLHLQSGSPGRQNVKHFGNRHCGFDRFRRNAGLCSSL